MWEELTTLISSPVWPVLAGCWVEHASLHDPGSIYWVPVDNGCCSCIWAHKATLDHPAPHPLTVPSVCARPSLMQVVPACSAGGSDGSARSASGEGMWRFELREPPRPVVHKHANQVLWVSGLLTFPVHVSWQGVMLPSRRKCGLHAPDAYASASSSSVSSRPPCLCAAQLLLPRRCWLRLCPPKQLRWVCASDKHGGGGGAAASTPECTAMRATGCGRSVTDNTPAVLLLLLLQSIQRILRNRAAHVTCELRARSEGAAWCRATRPSTQPAPCGVASAECHSSKLLVLIAC